MLLLVWFVLCLVVVFFLALPSALWRREILQRYAGSRPVACPENRQPAVVKFDGQYAVETEMDGRPALRLCECSRWPERSECNQACMAEAVQSEPYRPGRVKDGKKQIYHIPIALAAFAAWCVGALWHSQFMFRAQWTDAVGLTRDQVKQLVWWSSPHLLTFAICLLFAYGVGWLLAASHRKGVFQGVLMSILLGGALAMASWFGIAGMPHELFAIEAGYAVLAALIVGVIVGGLSDKLILTTH